MQRTTDVQTTQTEDDVFIFVTGGVMSGLGKGITAASIGRLLKDNGYDVSAVKIDPYLNVDAGTMSPFEHGEVFVLDDGSEVDLDLGNYERFLNRDMSTKNNITTGTVYQEVLSRERAGDYLGETVQIIPHVTDEIKSQIRSVSNGSDVCIVEVGGTVGDIEGMPFLEAIRQFSTDQPDGQFLQIHVTLLPESNNGELKTKPTQHSVKELRSIGLQPDVIVGRSSDPLTDKARQKIATFCDVPNEAVFSNPDVPDVYDVPILFEQQGIDEYIMDRMALPETEPVDQTWHVLTEIEPTKSITVAMVGKYDIDDAYHSIYEALKHAELHHEVTVDCRWVHSESLENGDTTVLDDVDGIIVPGGFGPRGTGGKVEAARYARENDVPFLGLCLGFQMAVVEYARNVVGLDDAHSTEIEDTTPHPVISILPEQYEVEDMGGTMRLGAQTTTLKDGTIAQRLYGENSVDERHRHRYEVNPEYIDVLEEHDLVFSGYDENRMEILELPEHSFFMASQFHPEFTSRPDEPHPMFTGFVAAAAHTNIDVSVENAEHALV